VLSHRPSAAISIKYRKTHSEEIIGVGFFVA